MSASIHVSSQASSQASQLKRRAVVLGNGASGSKVAARLAKLRPSDLDITVVSPFDYIEISLCMTKVLAAGPEEHGKALYGLVREPGVRYVLDAAAALEDGQVRLLSGDALPYDVCIIATGQSIPIFLPSLAERSMQDRRAKVDEVHNSIKQADKIVIAGAGPIGVELAADIKLRYKDKSIALVSHQEEILSGMSPVYRRVGLEQLESYGVEVIKSSKVVKYNNGEVTFESGEKMACDYYIPAFSTGGNAAFLPEESKNNKGYAIVNDCFQVKNFTNVFAIGDW
jgi:apoptosis-inducing factor 2